MFREATQSIVEEIDSDGYTLIPLSSLYQSDCCKPLHLLTKKEGFLFFTKDKYVATRYKVTDILKDGPDSDFEWESSDISCYIKSFSVSGNASVGASVGVVEAGVDALGSASSSVSVDMKKRTISAIRLLEASKTRKVDRGHSLVNQLRNNHVYIISEVVEADKPCSLKSTSQASSGIKAGFKALKAKLGFGISVKEELSIPAGTTIAYKVLELRITSDDTFAFSVSSRSHNKLSSPDLRAMIVIALVELTKLSKDVSLQFLNAILENLVLSDNLPVLETMLDQVCEGLQPDLQVLDLMEDENRACVEKMLGLLGIQKADPPGQALTLTPHQNGVIKATNILIESLSELNPDTLILLAASVEMKIISTQLKLVERIEERMFPLQLLVEPLIDEQETGEKQETEETLVLQLTDEEFEITQQMFEEFGFQLQRENASNSRIVDCGKKQKLLHVFAALSVLNALNN
uniref:gasdermin-A3-like n=1 Tax=Pristiophorus japonicus TaxID=55135 RepID=UPI00398EE176